MIFGQDIETPAPWNEDVDDAFSYTVLKSREKVMGAKRKRVSEKIEDSDNDSDCCIVEPVSKKGKAPKD